MLSVLKSSLFIFGIFLVSNVNAATGDGHAQTQLANPLTVSNAQTIDFGVIAIDPAADSQTVSIDPQVGTITCPASYICNASGTPGRIQITAGSNTIVYMSIVGSTATLTDGLSNTVIFDPFFYGGDDTRDVYLSSGSAEDWIGGTITFTGNEPAGVYNTTNAGGSGYTITVNY